MSDLISLIVPFYNEGDAVEAFASALLPCLDAIPDTEWEIICIDDGSTDATLVRLAALAGRDARFKIIEFSRNFGKEAALTAGLDFCTGAAIIPIDADLQDPPSLIAPMIAAWREGAEVVLARRIDRVSDGMLKRQTASWFYKLHNMLSKTHIPENVGDYRLMDRLVVEALKKLPERQRFMKGLFAWVGFRSVTIDYVRAGRSAGQSKFSGLALWNFALEGFTSFSTLPLKIWTYLGACSALLTFSYAIFITLRTIIFGISVPGYASLLVAVLFFGSVQLLSIGLLGEYIGRIYIETKQRPGYLVRKVHQGGVTRMRASHDAPLDPPRGRHANACSARRPSTPVGPEAPDPP
jgi:glycosyltransferase involved in cell wall biosynthesis